MNADFQIESLFCAVILNILTPVIGFNFVGFLEREHLAIDVTSTEVFLSDEILKRFVSHLNLRNQSVIYHS